MKNKIIAGVLAVLLVVSAGLSIFLLTGANSLEKPESLTVVSTPNQTSAITPTEFKSKPATIPKAPAGVNLALKKYATANDFQDVYEAKNAVDGLTGTYWEGKANNYPNELTVDLGKDYTVTAFRLKLNPLAIWSARTETFSVSTSEDGTTFTTLVPSAVYNFDPTTGNLTDIILNSSTKTRFVKFSFTANTQATGGQVAEAQIYGPGN